jgi:hypothetical protein
MPATWPLVSLNPGESDAPDALSRQMAASFLEKIFTGKAKEVKTLLMGMRSYGRRAVFV